MTSLGSRHKIVTAFLVQKNAGIDSLNHQEIVSSYTEKPIEDYVQNASGIDITPCLQARDADWRKKLTPVMTATFKKAQYEIDSQLNSNAPIILINKANSALDSIDSSSNGFKNNADSISKGLDDLIKKAKSLKAQING